MLFNSFIFIFCFLPIAVGGFHLAARYGCRLAGGWLVLSSLVFYGWWDPRFVLLLLGSIGYNFTVALLIEWLEARPSLQTWVFRLGVAGDLGILCYYKYLYAILEFARFHGIADVGFGPVVLPLGISFFTFTQLGFLVDVKQGVTKDRGFLNYLLFVTFFPHLIAGPILHNREMMPQFADPAIYRFSSRNLAIGLTIFIIGLAKKCVLADPLSPTVAAGFDQSSGLPLFSAWNAVLCYSLQIYFDFSGYSDMAIGLARMFNVRFPLNFNSPFKSRSVVEYWQRWHMTLTRFITLYLYNPMALRATRRRLAKGLDASRKAQASVRGFAAMVAVPTLITMALAGVWHGAGLQFLIFGLLHGVCITVNHAVRVFRQTQRRAPDGIWATVWKILLTYCVVLVGFVFFRAASVEAAMRILGGMIGLHGLGWQTPYMTHVVWICVLYAIVWALPNTQQIMIQAEPALGRIQPGALPWLRWRESPWWSIAIGFVATAAIMAMGGTTEFIYFQF